MSRALIRARVALLVLLGGCARVPDTGVTTLKPASLGRLQATLLERKADVEQFRVRGPFEVTVRNGHVLDLSEGEQVETDLYLSASPGKAPLVILLHGYENTKENHAYQALHLASWGMHSLCVQLPNLGPWDDNGRLLARLAALIHRRPELVDPRIDTTRIILAGHSYGASSVAIALADGAPAAAGILLDPAGVGRNLPGYLRRIRAPVMVLGADAHVSLTRNRGDFYAYIRRDVAEVSITGAHHEDAEFPLDRPPGESSATEELQVSFVAALTSAALSLGLTGRLDYAWESFGDAVTSGRMHDASRK